MRYVKILGYVVAAVVVVAVLAFAVIYFSSEGKRKQTFAVTPRPVAIPTGPEAVARGRHLAMSRGCVDCHGKDFGGEKIMDSGAMGKIYGANLTSGAGGLIGYKDEDWVRAIRHGVMRDGRGAFLMPSDEYAHLSDADLGALVAFMKTLPPVNRERVPITPGPITRMLLATGKMKIPATQIDHANLQPPTITPGVTVDYGRYLAVACIACHGPNYSGGKIEIGPPDWPPARNLTPHPSGDLAKWAERDFVRAIREAKRPDGTVLNEAMPRGFAAMNDEELGALWLFFKSLPPVATGKR